MEVQRGVCLLCSENTRVLTPSDAEEFTKYLPEILEEAFLPEAEFLKIKTMIKICGVCVFKIQTIKDIKKVISTEMNNLNVCRFCKIDKCIVNVDNTWKNFMEKTEGYVVTNDFPLCVCPRCIFYFDTVFSFKKKLSAKFPQLAIRKKKPITPILKNTKVKEAVKESETPKRKSQSKSPPSSKKRKIFDNCFNYLQPLSKNKFQVEDKLKKDLKLYRKVAYINMFNLESVDVKETPKSRPVIKIKLKPKHKKVEKESKSLKSEKQRSESKTKRSPIEHKNLDESIDETPKCASANLVPKRRVSIYMNNGENEEKKDASDEEKIENSDEEKKENSNEEKKENSNEEKKENSDEEKKESSDDEKKENSDEEKTEIVEDEKDVATKDDEVDAEKIKEIIDITKESEENGENEDTVKEAKQENGKEKSKEELMSVDLTEEKNEKIEDENEIESNEQILKDISELMQEAAMDEPLLETENGKEEALGENSKEKKEIEEKKEDSENSETDLTNGSPERKKKRVTFSDEILDEAIE